MDSSLITVLMTLIGLASVSIIFLTKMVITKSYENEQLLDKLQNNDFQKTIKKLRKQLKEKTDIQMKLENEIQSSKQHINKTDFQSKNPEILTNLNHRLDTLSDKLSEITKFRKEMEKDFGFPQEDQPSDNLSPNLNSNVISLTRKKD